jgi:hypothetical protein
MEIQTEVKTSGDPGSLTIERKGRFIWMQLRSDLELLAVLGISQRIADAASSKMKVGGRRSIALKMQGHTFQMSDANYIAMIQFFKNTEATSSTLAVKLDDPF